MGNFKFAMIICIGSWLLGMVQPRDSVRASVISQTVGRSNIFEPVVILVGLLGGYKFLPFAWFFLVDLVLSIGE